jgi:hypothetical protein
MGKAFLLQRVGLSNNAREQPNASVNQCHCGGLAARKHKIA